MRKVWYCVFVFFILTNVNSQQASIVTFRHDLRWVDESKFPNYFLIEEVRDSIFKVTQQEIGNYLNLTKVKLPEEVSYTIINGFGKQKITMPKVKPENDYEVGIFSFITRSTVGFSVQWKFNIVIKQKDKIVFQKEVVHELEYYNVSGYLTTVRWLDPEKFQAIYIRLLKETLGILPSSDKVIVIGSLEELETKAQSFFPTSTRHLLKIDGNWKAAENFVAQLERPSDTVLSLRFRDKLSWEFPKPTLTGFLAQVFSDLTKIEVTYDELVKRKKKAILQFYDGEEVGILLKWVEIQTSSTFSEEVYTRRVGDPLVAELYSKDNQIGYFVYVKEEYVHETNKTREAFNPFSGYQFENSLGIEQVHRIEGNLYDKPFFVEYNENTGIIEVVSGDELLSVMVIENINPNNRSISDTKLSKNKKFVISGKIKKSSLNDVNSQEWFPVYMPENFVQANGKIAVQSLIYLFFGMGNM